MKKILSVTFLLLSVIFTQAAESNIHFENASWKEVQELARTKKKMIFLYAYTRSCRYCKQMEKEVFTDQKVADYYNANFVSYKINIDDGAEGEALSKVNGIAGFPTYIYFDENGKKVHQSVGGKLADAFITDGKNATDPQTALFVLKEKYDRGDRTPPLLLQYGAALAFFQSDDSPQKTVVEEYLATQSADQLLSEDNLRFIFSQNLDFNAVTTQYFLARQRSFVPLFGTEEVERKTRRIITFRARAAGRATDPMMWKELNQIIRSGSTDTSKYLSLAQIYYHSGRQDWLRYAKETERYGQTLAGNDWQTLYETGAYLKAFAKDKETLTIGGRIMEQVIKMNKNYEHLCIYARLQSMVGQREPALSAARDALKLAEDTGKDSEDARKLIAELTGAKDTK